MEKNKPVQSLQLGSVRAAIWVNKGQNGTWCNVTLSRRYWDEKSRAYKDTHSFNVSHVPLLSKILDQVYTSMYELDLLYSNNENMGNTAPAGAEPVGADGNEHPTSPLDESPA